MHMSYKYVLLYYDDIHIVAEVSKKGPMHVVVYVYKYKVYHIHWNWTWHQSEWILIAFLLRRGTAHNTAIYLVYLRMMLYCGNVGAGHAKIAYNTIFAVSLTQL